MDYYDIILKQLDALDPKILGKWHTPQKFCLLIKKAINALDLPTKMVCNRQVGVTPPGQSMMVGGKYLDEDDEDGYPAIRLNWVFESRDIEIFGDKEEWDLTKVAITDIMTHELIHLEQYRKRNFDGCTHFVILDGGFRQYLSDLDEIQCYAYNSARELNRYAKGDWKCLLKQEVSDLREISPTMFMYMKAFGNGSKVRKIFFSWVYFYINKIENL